MKLAATQSESVRSRSARRLSYWIVAACLAGASIAQPQPIRKPRTFAAKPAAFSTQAKHEKDRAQRGRTNHPVSRSEALAQPATVTLHKGALTVTARDSDLSQILQQISRMSGMSIQGTPQGPRVFGIYGPASPREVLTQLLAGSGCNFMMLGATADGAPRELLLAAQTAAPPTTGNAAVASKAAAAPSSNAQDQEPLGPGAIAHVPPTESPDAEQDPATRAQQELQRLIQMHQRLEQQNNPQP